MKVLVRANVLVVGLGNEADSFQRLPIRSTILSTGSEAVSSLRNEEYDAVVSRWNLADMADGQFLKGLKLVKPSMSIIAVVQADKLEQEISARSLGLQVVLSENCGQFMFEYALGQLLKLKPVTAEPVETAR